MFKQQQPKDNSEEYVESYDDEIIETVVGPSVNVEGDFTSEGNITVKGTVSGSVQTSRMLTVEEGAQIFASVKAGEAYVSGDIKGNVKVEHRLELASSAQVLGDITCGELVVEAGALVQGKISMKGIEIEGGKGAKATTRTRRTTKKTPAVADTADTESEE